MKSWGIAVVSVVGFLVGMILAGVGGLFAKTNPDVIKNTENTVEYYWADAGVTSKELFELVSNQNCQTSEKYFLACVNSVLQVVPRYHLELSPKTGKLEGLATTYGHDGKTEKENLAVFVKMYEKQENTLINFESIWAQILKNPKVAGIQSMVIGTGINGFLSIYKDPHTYIMPSRYYEEIASTMDRSNLFVGVSFEIKNNSIFVRKVTKGSDAEAGGLKEQDQLLQINELLAKQLLLADISVILRNSKYKKFDLVVRRDGKDVNITINRSFKVLKHVIAEKKTGLRDYSVITISKFNSGVCAEVADRIKELSVDAVSGIILDLRDNPGGQLDEASCLAGLFIGINKKIYSVKYFDPLKSDEVVLTTGSLLYTGPLVVLVNSSSASASELLAGALQDYNRAVLVGERTFGKGTFQEPEVWSKNSKVALFKTQGFYLLPSGHSPQLKGITPDFIENEPHIQLREEASYFNPIAASHYLESETSVKAAKNYSTEFEKCIPNAVYDNNDVVLNKGLEVLACHRISSMMATQFATTNEFN